MDTEPRNEKLIGAVDYDAVIQNVCYRTLEDSIALLLDKLPYAWCKSYKEFTLRSTDIVEVEYEGFRYIFDSYSDFDEYHLEYPDIEIGPRVVVAYGRSKPKQVARDDYRLKGWVGPTEKMFGGGWDKGHYIAHSIGGDVDGREMNVFQQRRHLNRGRSEPGKLFRQMEKECAMNVGTFCFHQALYDDQSTRPAFLEFGLLRANGELWVERFDNR